MKLEFFENDWGMDIHLEPETLEEVAQIARFANNVKSTKPTVYFQFSTNIPNLYISMPKVAKHLQRNSISNSK